MFIMHIYLYRNVININVLQKSYGFERKYLGFICMQKQHFKIKSFGKQQKTKTTLFCITHYFPTELTFQTKFSLFDCIISIENITHTTKK